MEKKHGPKKRLMLTIGAIITGFVWYLILNVDTGMYTWKALIDLDYKVKSIDFMSPEKGWKVEYIHSSPEGQIEPKEGEYRVGKTEDGGRSWEILYTTDIRIYKIRYIPETQALFALGREDKSSNQRKIYVSRDEGYSWETVCLLTFAAQGLYFFNEDKGYAWTSDSIYGTYDRGSSWQKFAKVKLNRMESYENKQIIGNDQSIYFIEDQKVYKFNFWKGVKVHLPLPAGLEPEAVIVKPVDEKVAVLCKKSKDWILVEFENGQLTLTEPIPVKEKEFSLTVFSYGDNLINLIGTTTGSFFNTYHFYLRDKDGWHKESISGSNNYSKFAHLGDYAWAFRVALWRGTRELLFRDVVTN